MLLGMSLLLQRRPIYNFTNFTIMYLSIYDRVLECLHLKITTARNDYDNHINYDDDDDDYQNDSEISVSTFFHHSRRNLAYFLLLRSFILLFSSFLKCPLFVIPIVTVTIVIVIVTVTVAVVAVLLQILLIDLTWCIDRTRSGHR